MLSINLIIIALVLSGVESNESDKSVFYVNIVAEGKNPTSETLCGGVCVKKFWAISSGKCVSHLFQTSDTLMVTAGHSNNKGPEQTAIIDQTFIPPETRDIVLIKLKTPLKKRAKVKFAKLPKPRYQMCKDPIALEFLPKSDNDTATFRLLGFIFGLVIDKEARPRPPPPFPTFPPLPPDIPDDGEDDEIPDADQYPPFHKGGYRFIASTKSEGHVCKTASGWPLLCGEVLVGIESKCTKSDSDVATTEFASVQRYMRFIARVLKNNGTDIDVAAPPPTEEVVNAKAGFMCRRVHGAHNLVLFLLAMLIFANVL